MSCCLRYLLLSGCVWALDSVKLYDGPDYCFELPIVILTPSEPLPQPNCIQGPLPSIKCMKEPRAAEIEVVYRGEKSFSCLNMTRTSIDSGIVHYRGQSSLTFEKHQINVHFHKDSEWLGFPSDRHFILNGPFIDATLLRNHLAHWLFRETGRYSPRTKHVVLFIQNAETGVHEYKGIYLAMEKIAYGKNRVGLAQLDATCDEKEMSGGWAWEVNPLDFGSYSPNIIIDKYQALFGYGQRPILKYPQGYRLTQTMRDYFVDSKTGPLPQLYEYLYNSMTEPDKLATHIDIGSYVDYFLHTEMSLNQDGYRRSAYFFKDRHQPINAGPVWDFNLAYGIGAYTDPATGWLYMPSTFWKRLLCNYQFTGLVIKRWRDLRATVWSTSAIQAFITNSASVITRQLDRCPEWTSQQLQCANVGQQHYGTTYEQNIQILVNAIESRALWMDAHVGGNMYKALNDDVCSAGGPLPNYNCAVDGNDSRCLSNPEPYISSLQFPPIRKPYTGKPCSMNPSKASTTNNTPSIDYCWLSVGTYLEDGSITPFCSGNGFCPAGPGAKCVCIRGTQPPSCAKQTNLTLLSTASSIPTQSESWLNYVAFMSIVAFVSLVTTCVHFQTRKPMKNGSNNEDESRLLTQSPNVGSDVYGSIFE